MRAVWVVALGLCVVACGGMRPVATYPPIGDLWTTTPRNLAEGGHGDDAQPPAGLRWDLLLEGYEAVSTEAASPRRYVLTMKLVDGRPVAERRARPVFGTARIGFAPSSR